MSLPLVSSEVRLEAIVEQLHSDFTYTEDFSGLRVLGNFYEMLAQRHRSSDVSRLVVIEWFEKAADTYEAALTAYTAQSEAQLPGFDTYLEYRIREVKMLAGLLKPYGSEIPLADRVAEAITAEIR